MTTQLVMLYFSIVICGGSVKVNILLVFFQGLQPLEQSDVIDGGTVKVETAASEPSNSKPLDPKGKLSMGAALQGKPKRYYNSKIFIILDLLYFFCNGILFLID